MPLSHFKEQAAIANMGIRDFSAPGGESWKNVNSRAVDFIKNEVIAKYFYVGQKEEAKYESEFMAKIQQIKPKKLDIAVISHGGFIMEFINATKKFQDPKFEAVFKNNTKNTSITVVKLV